MIWPQLVNIAHLLIMAVSSTSDTLAKSDWQPPDGLKPSHTIHSFGCCFNMCLPHKNKCTQNPSHSLFEVLFPTH